MHRDMQSLTWLIVVLGSALESTAHSCTSHCVGLTRKFFRKKLPPKTFMWDVLLRSFPGNEAHIFFWGAKSRAFSVGDKNYVEKMYVPLLSLKSINCFMGLSRFFLGGGGDFVDVFLRVPRGNALPNRKATL